MTNETSWSFETKQIHAGQQPDGDTGARALPIYQTTSFVFDSAKQAADRFALAELGPIYTRITNPTQEAVETRIAELEGGVGGLLLASGQSAELLAILNIAEAGDHVVASPNLYGGTYNLLRHTLPKFGITTTFVTDADEPQAWRDAVAPNTKLFFGESIPNPKLNVFDIETVAAIAHENGVPLVIDNTVATPYLIRPFEYGADIIIHSATKYLGGHGTSIAGIIVDGGRFDWSADPERFPGFNTPDPSYGGLVFKDLGAPAYILKARVQLLRDMGPAISPFNAFLIGQGVETLSLRMDRHIANAQQVAEFLESQDQVTTVGYPGLPSSPWHERARKYAPKGPGAVLTFELTGGYDAGIAFVDALTLHSNVANIGDVRSLVIHPASTTHSQLDDAALAGAGVSPGLVRLAVGLEHIDDIIADIATGLEAAAAVTAAGGGTAA